MHFSALQCCTGLNPACAQEELLPTLTNSCPLLLRTLQYDETGESELDAGLSAPLQGPLTSALSGLEELLSL